MSKKATSTSRYYYYTALVTKRNLSMPDQPPFITLTVGGMVEWENKSPFNPIILAETIRDNNSFESVIITFLYELSEEEFKAQNPKLQQV